MSKESNYSQIATDIVQLVGGQENIHTLGYCMTRLRFVLIDESKADADAIRKVDGVLGVVSAGGQFIVIMGKNLLPSTRKQSKIQHKQGRFLIFAPLGSIMGSYLAQVSISWVIQ